VHNHPFRTCTSAAACFGRTLVRTRWNHRKVYESWAWTCLQNQSSSSRSRSTPLETSPCRYRAPFVALRGGSDTLVITRIRSPYVSSSPLPRTLTFRNADTFRIGRARSRFCPDSCAERAQTHTAKEAPGKKGSEASRRGLV
jgi:hypothetical protein